MENKTLQEAIKHMDEHGFAQFRGKDAMENSVALEEHFKAKGKSLYQMSFEGSDFSYYDPHHPENKGTRYSAEHLEKQGYNFKQGGETPNSALDGGTLLVGLAATAGVAALALNNMENDEPHSRKQRPLSALARDRKYTSREEWEKAYTPHRKSKTMRYKTKEEGGTAAQETPNSKPETPNSENGGRPLSAIMRDRYNTNASEPWEVNYKRKTRARNRAEGGSAGRYTTEVGDEKITVIKNKKEVTGYPVYARVSGYAPVTVDVYPTKEIAEAEAKKLQEKNKMAHGGTIKNQYSGKTPQQVWDAWSEKQKSHFLQDHGIYDLDAQVQMSKADWEQLYPDMQRTVEHHVYQGQYNHGGEIDEEIETYEPDWENDDAITELRDGKYGVQRSGKLESEHETMDEALAELRRLRHAKNNNWFPTIWWLNERGNYWAIDENGNEIKQAGGALGGGVVPFFQSLDMSKLPPSIRSVVEPVATHKEIIYVREGHSSFEKFLTLKKLLETKFPDAIKKPEAPKPAAPQKPDVNVLKTRLLLINEMMKKADAAKKAILKTRASIVREMIASVGKKEEGGLMGKGGVVALNGKRFTIGERGVVKEVRDYYSNKLLNEVEYEGTNYTRNKVYKTYNSPTNALLIITEKAEGGKAGEKLYASGGKVEWKKAEALGKDYLYTIHNGTIYAVSAGEVNNGKADPDAIFIIDEDHFLTPESADHFKKKMQALFPDADIDAAMRVKAE